VSLKLCELVFPKWAFELMLSLRSHATTVRRKGERDVKHALYMLSTMGNGFTFPIQTVIFASILRAVSRVFLPGIQARSHLAVFGDDLICSREIYRQVDRYLRLFGFRPNARKTFHEGGFRESCGTDWFYGQPVRPVFIKKIRSLQDYFVAINRFNEWSSYTGIPLKGTCSYLLNSIGRRHRVFVPYCEGLESGVRVPFSLVEKSDIRHDGNGTVVYNRYQARPWSYVINDLGIVTQGTGRRPFALGKSYLELSAKVGKGVDRVKVGRDAYKLVYPHPIHVGTSGDRSCNGPVHPETTTEQGGVVTDHSVNRIRLERNFKPSATNPDGLYISFLLGEVKSMRTSIRHDAVTYHRREAKIPWWDFMPLSHTSEVWFNWQQWETAVSINLDKAH